MLRFPRRVMPKTTRSHPSLRAAAERLILRIWFGHGTFERSIATLLAPLAWLTRQVSIAQRQRIRALTPPSPPVVVVGNLVVGGAGKTPLVIAIARALSARGLRPGILCAGYRGERSDPRLVTPCADAREHGDEAVLLAQANCGLVAAGADRGRALATLLNAATEPLDAVIADDGLQHTKLPRSIEIAVFDRRGVGNGRLLPAGPLREPLLHLPEIDAVALNDGARAPTGSQRSFSFKVEPRRFVPLVAARPGVNPGAPAHEAIEASAFAAYAGSRRITALAGMGHPERFFATLETLGLEIHPLALEDHAPIDRALLGGILSDIIVMTSKDAVKCADIPDLRCWVLEVSAEPEPAFIDWLVEALRGSPPA